MLLILACSIAGCHASPDSQGSYLRLPSVSDPILVIGNRSSAVSAAVTWLQNRGLTALEMPGTSPVVDQQEMTDLVQRLGARVIVWVEQTGDLRAPTISVRGIETGSSVVLWSGQANATTYRSSPIGARITWLTCHALSAAWSEKLDGARC